MKEDHRQKQAVKDYLFWIVLLLAVVLGGYLRVVAAFDSEVSIPIRADAVRYYAYAFNIRTQGIYSSAPTFANPSVEAHSDALVNPGYPLFVAALMSVDDPQVTLRRVVVAQALLGIGVVIVFAVLLLTIAPRLLALPAVTLIAINPHLINCNVYLLTESLFTFQIALFFLALFCCIRRMSFNWFVLAGLALGLASMTRPTALYFGAILPVVFLFLYRVPHLKKKLLVMVLAIAVAPLAWAVRNHVSVDGGSGSVLMANFLHHGSYPGFMFENKPESFGFPYRFDPDNAEISGKLSPVLHRVVENFRADPAGFARWYIIGKPVFLYSWDIIAGAGDIFIYPMRASPYFSEPVFQQTHGISKALHVPVLALCFLGVLLIYLPSIRVVLTPEQYNVCVMLSCFLLYFTGLHVVGAPFPRYGIPMRPVLITMAAMSLFMMWRSVFGRGGVSG